jgi:hypothetical protein
MLGVTADTNVIISDLNFSGNPRHVLEMAEDGAILLLSRMRSWMESTEF